MHSSVRQADSGFGGRCSRKYSEAPLRPDLPLPVGPLNLLTFAMGGTPCAGSRHPGQLSTQDQVMAHGPLSQTHRHTDTHRHTHTQTHTHTHTHTHTQWDRSILLQENYHSILSISITYCLWHFIPMNENLLKPALTVSIWDSHEELSHGSLIVQCLPPR